MMLDPASIITHGTPPTAAGTERCNRCGATIPARPKPWDACPQCGHAPRTGMHGQEPSQLPTEHDPVQRRRLQNEIDELRVLFERERAQLAEALIRSEQLVRDLFVRATAIGVARERLDGRQREAGRDELLQPVRGLVMDAAGRLEQMMV